MVNPVTRTRCRTSSTYPTLWDEDASRAAIPSLGARCLRSASPSHTQPRGVGEGGKLADAPRLWCCGLACLGAESQAAGWTPLARDGKRRRGAAFLNKKRCLLLLIVIIVVGLIIILSILLVIIIISFLPSVFLV